MARVMMGRRTQRLSAKNRNPSKTTDTEDTKLDNTEKRTDASIDANDIPHEGAAPAIAPTASQPGNLAEISAQLRETAAEIAEITAQAGRLGIAIYAAKALRDATAPEALRRLVLERASAAADARDIVAATPSPVFPKSAESPIVAAAKKAAAADGKS